MLRRTKIVATMGPATDSLEVLTDMMRAGLDVEHLVTDEFEGLEDFEKAMALLENRRAMKVVFYPNGKPR